MVLDSMNSQEDAIRQSYERRKKIIEEAQASGLVGQEKANALILYQEAVMENDLAKIKEDAARKEIELQRKNRDFTLNTTADLFGSLSDIVGAGSKRAFNISKQLARVQTILSTYAAAQKAFESQIIPGDPSSLPRAYLAASAAVAAGIARLAQINRTAFSSSSASGGGVGGAPAQATPVFNASPSTGLPTGKQGGITNITINGGMLGSDDLDSLISQIRDATDRGDQILISRNSRNGIELRA